MTPSKIHGANFVFKAPPGVPNCSDLHVLRTKIDGNPAILSTWTPDDEERQRIADGADVCLTVLGTGIPPVALDAAFFVCDVCGEIVHPDNATIGGHRHREPCNAIMLAGETEEEAKASRDQLARDIGEALAERPDKYVIVGDGLYLEWDRVRPNIEHLQSVVRVLAAQLNVCGGHTALSARVAGDALAKMREHTGPEPALVKDEELEKWRARHDELGRALLGLDPGGTAHNFDHDALCRAAERARAAFVNAACDPAEVAAIGDLPENGKGCETCRSGRHENTEADPCPACGCPF